MAPGGRSGHRKGKNTSDEGSRETPWDLFNSARYSRSLAIGVAMAQCFRSSEALGIVDLAERLGVGRSTAHRYAATLQALGWLEQTQQRRYRLAHRSAWPGMAVLGEIALVTGCEPVLRDLRAQTGHTVSLGVLNGMRVTYVRRVPSHGGGQYEADGELRAGAHVPVHCTAVGVALLATLHDEELGAVLEGLELTRHTKRTTTSKHRLQRKIDQAKRDWLAVSEREFIGSECSLAAAIPGDAGGWHIAVELNAPAVTVGSASLRERSGVLVQDAALRIGERIQAAS